jgi:hypothetical protein
MRPINFSLQQLSMMFLLYHIILFLPIPPFSVHVRMECRLSDRIISPYPLNVGRGTEYVHVRKYSYSRKLSLLSFCHGKLTR